LILLLCAAGGYLYPDEARSILNQFGLEILSDFLPAPERVVSAKKKVQTKEAADRALSSYLPAEVGPEVVKTSEQYYREGFREFKSGNHMRARAMFELALQVNPAHQKARHYLSVTIHENENEIKRLIEKGKQSMSAGRMREARGYLNSAIRKTTRDEKDPYYIECNEALKSIEAGGKI
jgi:tetratricopeptide (TPR) repeat protein